ncbi:MAG: hypothetical protein IJF54_06745 [Clostridia bacterium]|nr:hypothetical protein [Clostridia bacterium]
MYIDEFNQDVSKEYNYFFEVSSFDAGYNRFIKPSSQLKFQQQSGEDHLKCFGLPYSVMYDKGMVFVATGSHSVIHRTPLLGEKLKIVTWHRGNKGVRFYRYYNWVDEKGDVIIESCGVFALVNPKTHSLLRPSVFEADGLPDNPDRFNVCGEPVRIKFPKTDNVTTHSRKVRYSDLDYNGHINNTVYADIVADHIPHITHKRITSMGIDFLKEALPEDVLEISTAVVDDKVYVKGTHSRGDCFCAVCTMENR